MPFVDGQLLQRMSGLAVGYEAVVPVWDERPQPLHAIYSRNCLPTIERSLCGSTTPALQDLLGELHVRYLNHEQIEELGGSTASFFNVNTPADLEAARSLAQDQAVATSASPFAIAIVGRSNSGKTTLMEGLIVELKARGYRVATVKRSAHPVEVDTPGKDSWRLAKAGSDAVFLAAPETAMLVERIPRPMELQDVLTRLGSNYDVILLEGYSETALPKIEAYRAEVGPLRCAPEELLAVVSDERPDVAVPHFHLAETSGLVSMLENRKYLTR
jgi:molybdopterin-guanine dinucleotide biosynthesis protein MobB